MMPVRPWGESGNHWPRSSSALSTGCVELTPALLQFMPLLPHHCSLGAWLPGGAQRGHPPAQQLTNRHNLYTLEHTHTYTHTHIHKHTCSLKFILSVFKRLAWFYTHNTVIKDAAAAAAKSLQSCPTLCDPIDSSPPGSPIPGILQARTLQWVAIAFSALRMRFR